MVKRKKRAPHGPGPRCESPRKKGRGLCPKPAGWGTSHPGKGRCKFHGGVKKRGDKRVKHGLYSKPLREFLEERLPEWDSIAAQTPDLSNEIGTLRAMVQHAAVRRGRKGQAKLDLDAALKVFDRLIKAVDAQHRTQRKGMVSLAAVQSYTEALGLVIAKHVKEPDVLARIEADARAIPILAGA